MTKSKRTMNCFQIIFVNFFKHKIKSITNCVYSYNNFWRIGQWICSYTFLLFWRNDSVRRIRRQYFHCIPSVLAYEWPNLDSIRIIHTLTLYIYHIVYSVHVLHSYELRTFFICEFYVCTAKNKRWGKWNYSPADGIYLQLHSNRIANKEKNINF